MNRKRLKRAFSEWGAADPAPIFEAWAESTTSEKWEAT